MPEVAEKTVVHVTLVPVTCCSCGGVYGLSERYQRERYEKGGTWHCPYCEVATHYRTSEVERLKSELARTKQRAEHREAALQDESKFYQDRAARNEKRRRAEKAAKTRIKNQIGRGICPCCNRGFANLGQHMQSQHPEFTQEGD
jgi:hypothetical protein